MKFFPSFIWAVRDFTLQRNIKGKDATEDEYLEFALKLKPGKNLEPVLIKNDTRVSAYYDLCLRFKDKRPLAVMK